MQPEIYGVSNGYFMSYLLISENNFHYVKIFILCRKLFPISEINFQLEK